MRRQFVAILAAASAFVVLAASAMSSPDDLVPQATVHGRAIDNHGKPIAGARLTLSSWNSSERYSWKTTSDQEGRFSLEAKPVSSLLRISADGYASQFRTHDVRPGENLGWDFTLARSARVSGRLVDTNGKPQASRKIELALERGSQAGPDVQAVASDGDHESDSDGRFDLSNVAPGKHSMRVRIPDRPGVDHSMHQYPVNARFLEVGEGEHLSGVELVVNPPEQFFVAGRLRDSSGRGVSGLNVMTNLVNGLSWRSRTDQQGQFRLEGLDGLGTSSFRLGFRHEGQDFELRDVKLGSDDLDVVLAGKANAQVIVGSAETSGPVAGCNLKVVELSLRGGAVCREPKVEVKPGLDGRFTILGIPAREATVEVRADGLVHRFQVALDPATTASLQCDLARPPVLEGRTTVHGVPKGMGITIDGTLLGTDQSGRYRFDQLTAGRHLLRFGYERAFRTLETELKPGETRRLDIDMGSSASIRGTVRFPAEEPFCSIRVASRPAPDGWPEQWGIPEPEEYVFSYQHLQKPGEYHLQNIPPGRYYLMAGSYRPMMQRSLLADMRPIDVKAGETLTVDFDLVSSAPSARTIKSDRPVARADQPKPPSPAEAVPAPDPLQKHPKPKGPDDYVGWYKIAGTETYVPVLKNADGHYYTVGVRGTEARLEETASGLTWGLAESSLKGTTISYDEATQYYFIAISDSMSASMIEDYESGKKQRLVRVRTPEGLDNPATTAPASLDDFVGWYEPLYMPFFRIEVVKNGAQYFASTQGIGDGKQGPGKKSELTVLPDQSGFAADRDQPSVTYSRSRNRFEMPVTPDGKAMIPLLRLPSPPPDTMRPIGEKRIGIPAWH